MACAPEWVTAYVDGELDRGSRLLMEQHLSGCRACAAQVGGERLVQFQLRALRDPRLPAALERRCPAPRRALLN